MSAFRASHLGFAYGLHDVSFEFPGSGLIAIAGPNGAGKSTLLGILAALRTPYTGSAQYDGREIRQWRRQDFARRVAFVPQALRVEFPFTAQELVMMGRAPFAQGWFETTRDHETAERVMRTTDTLQFAERDVRSLSGGERQRVILAAALAQEPEALLLDEPSTFLDLRHQLALYRMLRGLSRTMLVVAVTHDLNLAFQFADRVLVIEDGRIAADGEPRQVLDAPLIANVFGVQARVETDPDGQVWMRPRMDAE